MIKLSTSVCINAPTKVMRQRLAALEDIQLWSDLVLRARCDGATTPWPRNVTP